MGHSKPEVRDSLEYQQIIEQCRKGNRQAQRALFDHFAPKMLFLCRRYAVDSTEAEDMLQEGFIRMFGNLDQFRHDGHFEGWVRRIFVNSAIKYYRKSRKHNVADDLDSAVSLRHHAPDAVDTMSEQELMDLLDQLPQGYRMVFNLYAVEGFSHAEIGAMLQIEESTSRSQLLKARKMLQSKIYELQRVTTI